MSFKNQSVNTGIQQLCADAELCNKWQYQLPRQGKCLLHECVLTGQTPTRYLEMCSSAGLQHSKGTLISSEVLFLSSENCYVLIVITASCLHYDSAPDCVSEQENACHLLVDAYSGLWVPLFVNDSRGQQDIVFPGGPLIYFLFSFSHYSSMLTSVNYGQQIYGTGKIKPNLQIIFRASRQVQWQSWLAVIEFLAAICSVTRRCQLQGCQLRRVLIL